MNNRFIGIALCLALTSLSSVRAEPPSLNAVLKRETTANEKKIPEEMHIAREKEFLARLKEQPNDARLQYEYGRVLVENGAHSRTALKHFRRAVELEPKKTEFKLSLGLELLKLHEYSAGRKLIDEVMRENPQLRMQMLYGIGDFDGPSTIKRSVDDYNKRLKQVDQDPVSDSHQP